MICSLGVHATSPSSLQRSIQCHLPRESAKYHSLAIAECLRGLYEAAPFSSKTWLAYEIQRGADEGMPIARPSNVFGSCPCWYRRLVGRTSRTIPRITPRYCRCTALTGPSLGTGLQGSLKLSRSFGWRCGSRSLVGIPLGCGY